MKVQQHLNKEHIVEVFMLIESCSKYWRVLDEEDRDFLNSVRYAVEERIRWE